MYFAAQPNNVSLRIWSWPDGADTPSWVQPPVAPWSNDARQCPGPDGRNWCGFHDGRLQSGFVTGSSTTTYVRFGRRAVPEVFADGFESGDTTSWGASNP
jgi:hypothetical protein